MHAGMRELLHTGWLPDHMRVVVAVFLTEYLSLSWVHGEAWFHNTLLDADVAINAVMWQVGERTW